MRRRLLIISTVLAVLMVVASGGWWVWKEYYSAGQIRAAVKADDADRVYLLINLGAPVEIDFQLLPNSSPSCARNSDGSKKVRLLNWAAGEGHLDIVKLLLANGANVGAKRRYDNTPLHWAAEENRIEVVELLLTNGADPSGAFNRRRNTPLDLAIEKGHTQIADLLKAHMAKHALPPPDDEYRAKFKTSLGFSAWPGKKGPLKKGLIFKVKDYKVLDGFNVKVSERFNVLEDDLWTITNGVPRLFILSKGDQQLHITICVARTSTDNAHEFLLSSLISCNFTWYTRGDKEAVPVGDFNYISIGSKPNNPFGNIWFVRNNVTCLISDYSPHPSGIKIQTLANAIDEKIKALPDLKAQSPAPAKAP